MSVLGVVGAAAGFMIGGPQGAMLGYSLGSGVDALINAPTIEGPRLDDLKVQMASYGNPIPFEYATNRHAGTIMWPKEIILDEHEKTESAKGGPEQTTYSYSASFAVLICEGPIKGIRRIWANKRIIYDATGESDTTRDPAISGLRFYTGTETQSPDPLIEAKDGVSPAYLGFAYCVFEDLDLTDFANRPPQLEFEVLTIGDDALPDLVHLGPGGTSAAVDPHTGYVWSVRETYDIAHTYKLVITDPVTRTTINEIRGEVPTVSGSIANGICYVDSTNEFWIVNEWGMNIHAYDADSQTLARTLSLYAREYMCVIPPITDKLSYAGRIAYDKVSDLVLIASTNLRAQVYLFKPQEVRAVDPCDSTKFYYPNLYPKSTIDLPPEGSFFAPQLLRTGEGGYAVATTTHYATILHRGAIAQAIFSEDIGEYASGGAFDPNRNRLLIVNAGESKVVMIDIVTGEITAKTYDRPEGMTPDLSTNFRDIIYHEQTDRYYVTASLAGLKFTWLTINADSLEIEAFRPFEAVGGLGTLVEVPNMPNYVFYTEYSLNAWLLPVTAGLEPNPVKLGDIVEDICVRAGLSPAEIDVSQLTDLVDGYIVPRQMSARAAIEPLQVAFFFDAVESDNKLKFVKRGAGSPVVIPMEDRAAREFGSDLPDSLSIVRAQDMELPVQVDVEYADIDADHLVGNQYARRITKDTKSRVNIQSPVVMQATKAKQVADVTLYRAWLKQTYKFTTARKWAHLEPTDIVILPTQEASYTARIVSKREQPSGVIEWEAAMEGVEVYTQSGAGAAPTNYVKQSIYAPGVTSLHLLDIPILRDEDNNAGFYDVMAGTGSNWTGAQLFSSADGGSTYEPVHIIGDPATIGTAQSALPDFTAGNIVDEGSSLTIVMGAGRTLTSVTDTQLFNGANLAVIGASDRWEVIQFRTATLISASTYQLSGFLRGRRGTEWATGTHQAGDKFILAGLTGWNRVVTGADVGLERKYKAPAFRMPLSSTPATTFTNGAIGLKPFAPVDLSGARDADGNLTLKWNRRTRLATGTLHMPAPLGEAVEAYSIDILNGETVLRTLTSNTPSVLYSAADQAADGIAPGAPVTAAVYQNSQAVGRGYPLQGTV